jgi:SnoaL-like domain
MYSEITTDKDDIKDVVEKVHRYRDHAMWDKIEDYFVVSPYVDDSEMTSDAAGFKKATELVSNWRAELRNYFYATRHKIDSMRISQQNSKEATAQSSVMGQYFINDRGTRYVLNVDGVYQYDLVKRAGKWKIGGLKFKLKDQILKPIGL